MSLTLPLRPTDCNPGSSGRPAVSHSALGPRSGAAGQVIYAPSYRSLRSAIDCAYCLAVITALCLDKPGALREVQS